MKSDRNSADFDARMRTWAAADLADDDAVARILARVGAQEGAEAGANAGTNATPAPQPAKPARRKMPLFFGAGMAAAMAGLALFTPHMGERAPTATPEIQVAAQKPVHEDERKLDSFALLFTPTYEEEEYL